MTYLDFIMELVALSPLVVIALFFLALSAQLYLEEKLTPYNKQRGDE